MKLKPVHHGETNELLGYAHWCAGCECAHIFYTRPGSPQWTFNGNMESPSFEPSMRFFHHANKDKPEKTLCHYFLRDGVIEYLADSGDHDLRGKHPLQDIPDGYGI
jgi:hypothetical protein